MKFFVVSTMLVAVALAAPGVYDNQVDTEDGLWNRMSRAISSCGQEDLTSCLTVKGVAMLSRAARQQNIELMPGVTFTRDTAVSARDGKALSENDITSALPADPQEKSARLFDMITEATTKFISSHNLQFKIPAETTNEMARAIEEGRGKIKKLIGPVVLAIGAKIVALIPILLGGVLLLATKALIVSKIAFIFAAILGLQKLFGGSSGSSGGLAGGLPNILSKFSGGQNQGWSTYSAAPASASAWSGGQQAGWSSGSGSSSSYPYARSMDAQSMAYSGQQPAQ